MAMPDGSRLIDVRVRREGAVNVFVYRLSDGRRVHKVAVRQKPSADKKADRQARLEAAAGLTMSSEGVDISL